MSVEEHNNPEDFVVRYKVCSCSSGFYTMCEHYCPLKYGKIADIKESKNFISDCLRQLPKKLKDIAIIEVDRDTRGLAGAPDIGDAIFMKIDKADIL